MKKYTHNIPIRITLGVWTLLYMVPFFLAYIWFISEYSARVESKVIIFYIMFIVSVSFILCSTTALLLKKSWSIPTLSLGLHLFILTQIYAFILSSMSLSQAFFSFICFTFPIIPIILILHSQYFIKDFENEKNENTVGGAN